MKSIYNEHIDFINNLPDINNASDEEYVFAFKRLLSLLPNKGKLYKYKSGVGASFENAYKSLRDNYIWMTKVSEFNDRFDCTINYDYEKGKRNLLEYLDNNKIMVWRYYLLKEHNEPTKRYFTFTDKQNKCLLTGSLYLNNEGNLDKYGLSLEIKKLYGDNSQSMYDDCIDFTELAYKSFINKFETFKSEFVESLKLINSDRDSIHVFCLCERYDLNSMWAHYCNNTGLVIEYDFNKLLNQDISLIKKCISMYKVQYKDKQKMDLTSLFDSFYKMEDYTIEQNRIMLDQLTTKDKSWSFEREWRIILLNIEEKFPIDIVGAIYIDYEFLEKKKCGKLLALAKDRGWKVFIRKKNQFKNGYVYNRYVFK